MKTFKIIFQLILISIFFISCQDVGTTTQKLNGNEKTLPDELKGLKIYQVEIGGGGNVKVGILNGNINSTTYQSDDTNTIIIDKTTGKLIEVKQILVENDSVIVCRK